MPEINQLSYAPQIQGSEQIPLYDAQYGTTRRTSFAAVKDYVQSGITVPGGVNAISSYGDMRINSPQSIALTTTPVGLGNFNVLVNPTLQSPSATLYADPINGWYVAQRDIANIQFDAVIVGQWSATSALHMSLFVGSPTNRYESTFRFVGTGSPSAQRTARISGFAYNANNPFGVIKAGEQIRVMLYTDTTDTLNVALAEFNIRTMDGI